MVNRRQLIRDATVGSASLVCGAALHAMVGRTPDDDPQPSADPDQPKLDKVDWSLLLHTFGGPDPRRHAKAVRIELPAKEEDRYWINRSVNVECDDAALLGRIRFGGQIVPLRLAWPDDGSFNLGGGHGTYLGKMHVSSPAGQFLIGLSALGFMLDTVMVDARHIFYSYMLARTIDEILLLKAGIRLPPPLMEVLSGERQIRLEKEVYSSVGSSGTP